MEDNKILKLVYTFFLGLLLALFVGIGINTFYTPPVAPEYPTELNSSYNKEPTQEQIILERKFEKQMQTFEKEVMGPYSRNVSIIALTAAVLFLAASFVLEKKGVRVISDGVMLGGLFTLMYSLGRGFASQDSKYSFVAISIGLVIVLYLGYHRFVRGHTMATKQTVKKVA